MEKKIKEKEKEAQLTWGEIAGLTEDYEIYEAKDKSTSASIEKEKMLGRLAKLKLEFKAKENSINVLSGALLHIAKQAISTVHGNPYDISFQRDKNKRGTIIMHNDNYIMWNNPARGVEELRILDLIVAARNQYEHYESGLDDIIRGVGTELTNRQKHNINVFKQLKIMEPAKYDCILVTEIQNGEKNPKNFAGIIVSELLQWKSFKSNREYGLLEKKCLELILLFDKVYLNDPCEFAVLEKLKFEGIVRQSRYLNDVENTVDYNDIQLGENIKPLLINHLVKHFQKRQPHLKEQRGLAKKYVDGLFDFINLWRIGLHEEAVNYTHLPLERLLDTGNPVDYIYSLLKREESYPGFVVDMLDMEFELSSIISLMKMSEEFKVPFISKRVSEFMRVYQ